MKDTLREFKFEKGTTTYDAAIVLLNFVDNRGHYEGDPVRAVERFLQRYGEHMATEAVDLSQFKAEMRPKLQGLLKRVDDLVELVGDAPPTAAAR